MDQDEQIKQYIKLQEIKDNIYNMNLQNNNSDMRKNFGTTSKGLFTKFNNTPGPSHYFHYENHSKE